MCIRQLDEKMSYSQNLKTRVTTNAIQSHLTNNCTTVLTMVAMIVSNMDHSPEICSTNASMMTEEKVGQKRQRRAVTFGEEVKSRETYSSDQVQDCWYHHEDYKMFRKEMRQTVKLVNYNVHIDDVRHCQRGLEKCFKETARVRREVQGARQGLVCCDEAPTSGPRDTERNGVG
jgi:hypothetical protein